MASRKQRVESMHKADTEGKQWVLQLTRPITIVESHGIIAIINEAFGIAQ